MYAVFGIVECFRLSLECFFKIFVKRNIYVGKLVGKLSDNGKYSLEILSHLVAYISIEKKGSKHNYLRMGLAADTFKYRAIIEFYLRVGRCDLCRAVSVPDIVNADKYRDNVGIEFKRIGIKPVEKLASSVTAYAEIDKFKLNVLMIFLSSAQLHI